MSKTYILDRDNTHWAEKVSQIVADLAAEAKPREARIIAPDRKTLSYLRKLVDNEMSSRTDAGQTVYADGGILTYCLDNMVHSIRDAIKSRKGDIIVAFPPEDGIANFMEVVWSILIQYNATHLETMLRMMPVYPGDEFAVDELIRDPIPFERPPWGVDDGSHITPDAWKVCAYGSRDEITSSNGFDADRMMIKNAEGLNASQYEKKIGYAVMACVLGRHADIHLWVEVATALPECECKNIVSSSLGDYAYLFDRIHFYRINAAQ